MWGLLETAQAKELEQGLAGGTHQGGLWQGYTPVKCRRTPPEWLETGSVSWSPLSSAAAANRVMFVWDAS